MKVITIKQPFASLIVLGIKKYEFRTWKTKYRGDILIHAGKGVNKKAMEKFAYLNLSVDFKLLKVVFAVYLRKRLNKNECLLIKFRWYHEKFSFVLMRRGLFCM